MTYKKITSIFAFITLVIAIIFSYTRISRTNVMAATSSVLWAKSTLTAPNASGFTATTVDNSGNIYAVGVVTDMNTDTFDFGNNVTVAGAYTAGQNALIVKYNSSGQAQWARSTTAATNASDFNEVVVDGSGNIYAIGSITENGTDVFNFGNGATVTGAYEGSGGGQNALIVKYNSSGQAQWARSTTVAPSASDFDGASLDSSGNIYASGFIDGSSQYDFGNGATVTGNYGALNAVIVKYNSSGQAQWARSTVTGPGISQFYRSGSDSSDNIYVAGAIYTNGQFDFGNSVTVTGNYAGGANAVIVKYNSSGQAQWAKSTVTGPNASVYNSAVTDAAGNSYAVGYINTNGQFDFGDSITVNGNYASNVNTVIIKYNSSGQAQWARSTVTGPNFSYFDDASISSSGNIYASGGINGINQFDFGNGVTVSGGYLNNPLIIGYNSNGDAQWARSTVTAPDSSLFYGLASNSSGNIYAVGNIYNNSQFDFGNGVTVSGNYTPSNNALIVKYSESSAATTPTLTLTSQSSSTSDTTPTFSGTATADATRTISAVSYRIDGGAWESATASDSSFDAQVEDYTFTASALAVGSHTVQSKAIDNASSETTEASYASYTITITETTTPPEDPPVTTFNTPSVSLDQYSATSANADIRLSGSAQSDNNLSLQDVQYSFNKSNWHSAIANDGAYNTSQETFYTNLHLDNGSYTIYFRAEDSSNTFTPESGYAIAQFTVDVAAAVTNGRPDDPDDPVEVTEETTVATPVETTPESLNTQEIVKNNDKSLLNYTIIGAIIALLSMASLALGSLLTQISLKEYAMVLINSFLSLFARHKKDKFGIVYDATTDQPVSGALVNIFQFDNMKLVSSSLTDNKGHFYFTVSQGKYVISVIKSGYIFPSLFARNAFKQIEQARGVYFGQTLNISDEAKIINVKIPIDPSAKLPTKRHKLLLLLNSTAIRLTIMATATAATVLMLLYNPSTASYIIAGLYATLWILEFFIQDHELKFSRIIDGATHEPIDLALVRIIDKYGKLRKTYVSDYRGRVIPYINSRQDKLTIERVDYQDSEMEHLRAGFVENHKLELNKK